MVMKAAQPRTMAINGAKGLGENLEEDITQTYTEKLKESHIGEVHPPCLYVSSLRNSVSRFINGQSSPALPHTALFEKD